MTTRNKLFLLIFACSGLLLLTGLNSHLYLGDEVFHYRFARFIYEAGKRVAFDPLYGSGQPPGYFYIVEPLWHFILVLLWKVIGRVSFAAAQIYQAGYYIALILLTFQLGKMLYDEKTGLISALVIATMPMVVSFSILFYLDVPASVFTMLFLLLFLKEKYWWAGVSLGLMYMCKRNACFFLPVVPLMIIAKYRKDWLKTVLAYFKLAVPSFSIIAWDIFWRVNNIGSFYKQPATHTAPVGAELSRLGLNVDFYVNFVKSAQFNTKANQNSVLFNPLDTVKYLGISFLILLAVYFLKRKFEKKDFFLWVPTVTYLSFYFLFFGMGADIRYLFPIIPPLVIISSKGYLSLKAVFFKTLIIILCVAQILSACFYVHSKRQLAAKEKEAFDFIRKNIPDNQLLLYPEIIVLEEAEKKAVWGTLYLWPYFFWGNEKEKKIAIEKSNLYYIIVKHSRIYDDAKTRHLGGYPKSFVDSLPGLSFVKCIYNNGSVSIWKIDRNLTKITD